MTSLVETRPRYRPDIDGLRAIAVLSVIFFHIDARLLPGGFVGVDIFFVISGYLITRNVVDELARGKFSLLEFYRRRVKRIAPAMLLVIFTTVVFVQFFLLPEEAERAADSALWSLLSLSNVYFWLNIDGNYFAEASNELPILHLWSLGVEEQFYIVWPVLLMLLFGRTSGLALVLMMSVAAVFSFAYADHAFDLDPSFAYYMIPTRAGELLLGAIVALGASRGIEQKLHPALLSPLGWLGAGLMFGSLVLLSEQDVFPGWTAVPPTLGTALIILSGLRQSGRLTRFLSFAPMVGIGLVSYSAYLWHWPILAFIRYGYGEVTFSSAVLAFLSTFLLAWLTYRYVEQPARRVRSSAVKVFAFQYVIPAGALAIVCLGAMYLDGYGLRNHLWNYRAELASTLERNAGAYSFDYVCQKQRIREFDLKDARCVVGPSPEEGARVILWGDSNASHYVGMLGSFAKAAGFNFRNVAVGACPGVDGDPEPFVWANRLADCRESLNVIRSAVEGYDVVIMASSWSRTGAEAVAFYEVISSTAQRLAAAGKLVILLGKIPTIDGYDHRCEEKALSVPFRDCPNPRNPVAPEIAEMNAKLKSLAANTENLAYFEATDYLCPGGICSAFDDKGLRVYRDFQHVMMNASWRFGEKILAAEGLPDAFAVIKPWLLRARASE